MNKDEIRKEKDDVFNVLPYALLSFYQSLLKYNREQNLTEPITEPNSKPRKISKMDFLHKMIQLF